MATVLVVVTALLPVVDRIGDDRSFGLASPVRARQQATSFVPVAPARVYDSRNGAGPVAAAERRAIQVAGVGGVPASGVEAVAVNVTGISPSAATFVSVSSADDPAPGVSNLNLGAGQIRPVLAVSRLSASGQLAVYSDAAPVDIALDVVGYYPTGADLRLVAPERLLDTRSGLGAAAAGPLGPAGSMRVQVGGRAGLPSTGVGAVVITLTAVSPTADTYLTAWPSGEPPGTVSNLNLPAGDIRPNLAVVAVGGDGGISLFNAAGDVHALIDVVGWIPTSGASRAINPTRVLDTRDGTGIGAPRDVVGIDYVTVKVVGVGGVGGVPASGVGAVAVNVTGTGPGEATYLTSYPAQLRLPCTSTLNLEPGLTAANLAVTPVDPATGTIRIYNARGKTHVVADVQAWFPATAVPQGGARCGDILTSWVDAADPRMVRPDLAGVAVVARQPLMETDDATTVLAHVYRDPPGIGPSGRLELLDREGRTITPVDVAYDGGPPTSGADRDAVVSPDGRFIAFTSIASNLVPGDADQPDTVSRDVFLRDVATGSTWQVSAGAGEQLWRAASGPQISADGRFVTFATERSGPCPGCANQYTGYLWDRDTGALTALGTDRRPVALSRDGSTILLREGDAVVVQDRVSGVRTTIGSGETSLGGAIDASAISADGTVVVFADAQNEVRVWRRATGASTVIPQLAPDPLGSTRRVDLAATRADTVVASGFGCSFVSYDLVTGQSSWSDVRPPDSEQYCALRHLSVNGDGTRVLNDVGVVRYTYSFLSFSDTLARVWVGY